MNRNETLTLSVLLLLIAAVTLADVVGDVAAGGSWSHVAVEIVIIVVVLGIQGWLWTAKIRAMKVEVQVSEQRLKELELEAQRWQAHVAALKPRLSDAIDAQFTAWQLTNAEGEIARLILKGLTNKEIAELRKSSEQTIKQQTNAIYRKSGLTSRGQLAAFFLEDLF